MKKILMASVIALSLTGCATKAPFQPAMGLVYNNTKAPLSLEYENTNLGSKTGTSSAMSVLGLVALGDASVEAAAKNGKIRTVKHADYDFTNVFFGVYTKTNVYVYGD